MRQEDPGGYETIVRRAVLQIQRRLNDSPDFRELAAAAYMSPFHFHRLFDAMVGESPRMLTRRLRLERAADRLRHTAWPVDRVAREAGYRSPEGFARSFLAEFEQSPTAFRASTRRCLGLRTRCGVHYIDGRFTAFNPVHRGGPAMQVQIVTLPAQRVGAVPHAGAYWRVGAAFEELARRTASLDRPAGAPMVAAFYDDPESVPEAELRSIAGVIVALTDIGDLEEAWLPAGRYLVAEHIGHPSGLPQAWQRVYREHVPAGGHRLRDGITFEIYRSGDHTDPDSMRTELCTPIE
jgi:AraC family transcriptional regulator